MYKIKKVLLLGILAAFTQLSSVKAASTCDYNEQAELNSAVANIKATYEEVEEKIVDNTIGESGETAVLTFEYFKLTFYNLTEDFYLKITNDYNSEVKYINYSDSESGVAVYDWKEIENVVNFTITVYSSNNTNCPNEEYRIINLTTPRYNPYWNDASCSGIEDYYLCQKYITEKEEFSYGEFIKKINSYNEKKQQTEDEKENGNNLGIIDRISSYISENKLVVGIIATIIVVGGVVTTVIVIKKRRSRLI